MFCCQLSSLTQQNVDAVLVDVEPHLLQVQFKVEETRTISQYVQ
jgi:hypothetical protein